MPRLTLEQRVAALEQQVAQIKVQHANGHQDKSWLRTMGMFAGDEGLKEVFEEAMKSRDKDRQRFYRRFDKKTSARKTKT
jgi:hypothetical protein